MAKKVEVNVNRIPVSELEVNCVYKTYVQELVKILEINNERKSICLYNISGAHKQWVDFKNIYLTNKIR